MVVSTAQVRAWNLGTRKSEPYFGVIDYGLTKGAQASLHFVSRPPHRGLLGASVRVRDAASVAKAAGVNVVRATLPGFGESLIATVNAPNGA